MHQLPVDTLIDRKGALPGGNETILVIDDDPLVALLVSRVLEDLGYEVLRAGSGEEALKQAERHTGELHAIFTDVVMPCMTGPEVVGRIRASRPDVKVLYTSGYVLDGAEAVENGSAFVQKPFKISELAHTVRRVLDSGPVPGPWEDLGGVAVAAG